MVNMILNPFYWIRLFLYTFIRVQSVSVLKADGDVSWYYVRYNGMFKYIYSLNRGASFKLNEDFTLTNVSFNNLSCQFIKWSPLFTFWEKKSKLPHSSDGRAIG